MLFLCGSVQTEPVSFFFLKNCLSALGDLKKKRKKIFPYKVLYMNNKVKWAGSSCFTSSILTTAGKCFPIRSFPCPSSRAAFYLIRGIKIIWDLLWCSKNVSFVQWSGSSSSPKGVTESQLGAELATINQTSAYYKEVVCFKLSGYSSVINVIHVLISYYFNV